MPNGESKNWIRLCITLEGYRSFYGRWPETISLTPDFIEELQNKLTTSDFEKLQSKLKLIPDDTKPFECHDKMGNQFTYSKGLKTVNKNQHNPIKWLNITPPEYFD
jgi:hypothetical protein